MARALDLLIDGGGQVDHGAAFRERAPVRRVDHGAAAGRQYDGRQLGQPVDRFSLADPKPGFTFFFENERNVHAGFCLDVRVAVMKSVVKQPREMPSDRRLARSHRSDQKDVALGQHDLC